METPSSILLPLRYVPLRFCVQPVTIVFSTITQDAYFHIGLVDTVRDLKFEMLPKISVCFISVTPGIS